MMKKIEINTILNFLLLKVTYDIVRKNFRQAAPYLSLLNLPGILNPLASHLRIINYRRLTEFYRSSQSSYFLPFIFFFFSSSSFFLFISQAILCKYDRHAATKVDRYSLSSYKELIFRLR